MMQNEENAKPVGNPWHERFTWYFFTNKEVFGETTEKELEDRAARLAERGITTAILFTCTHFRFSFYPYWDMIIDSIGKITRACHKHNIRVVEHSSAVLTHDLSNERGRQRFADDIGSFTNWQSTPDDWKAASEFLTNNPEIDGVRLEDMYQIDGETGRHSVTQYNSPIICHNNPDYRRIYFKYLKRICDTGIDGIMNDDVAYFGNACTCEHCRRLFKEQTGYTLPEPENWSEFAYDFTNPVFLAWSRFKRASISEYYHTLNKYYRSLGHEFIYPKYVSDLLKHNVTHSDLDTVADTASFLFQENCFSAIMKASWPEFMAEAVHRYARAKRYKIPSMSMFYPNRADSVYFSWALARSWGQMYTGSCEGQDISSLETPYREFETRHTHLYDAPEKLEDIAFYFSRKTRDYVKEPYKGEMLDLQTQGVMFPFLSCMQAAYISGLGLDMVFESDTDEDLSKRRCIVVSHVIMAEDNEILRLSKYVQQGGKLIVLGEFARLRPDGTQRSAKRVLELMGFKSTVTHTTYRGLARIINNNQNMDIPEANASLTFELANNERAVCTGSNGSILGIAAQIGEGELIWVPAEVNKNEFQPTIWANRRQQKVAEANAVPSVSEIQRSTTGALLRLLCDAPKLQITCNNQEVIGSCFAVAGGLAVHLVNLADTVEKNPCKITHEDIIQNFAPNAEKLDELTVEIRKTRGTKIKSAILYTPEQSGGIPLKLSDGQNSATLRIPADTFAAYAVIDIQL